MTPSQDSRTLYLDLMKKTLTFSIWGETNSFVFASEFRSKLDRLFYIFLHRWLKSRGIFLCRHADFVPSDREVGLDHPTLGFTMIGLRRMENIQFCMESVLKNNVRGDFIETGVWRGGATIFMRAVLKAYGIKDRKVWVADSFEGLPKPDPDQYPADSGDEHYLISHLAISEETVKENFDKFGLLDDQVVFLKGWFKDTLPHASIDELALMRLDGDMYESTIQALESLYPKLTKGGYVIIDDYGYIESCRQAVHDFREKNKISDEIKQIDWSGVYWQRT